MTTKIYERERERGRERERKREESGAPNIRYQGIPIPHPNSKAIIWYR